MLLVDTSVWADHLGRGDLQLARHLDAEEVATHPFVIAELALGNLSRPTEVMTMLHALPQVPVARHSELLALIEAESLSGRGIGFVDAHLLASTRLDARLRLWSRDKRLDAQAQRLGCAWRPKAA